MQVYVSLNFCTEILDPKVDHFATVKCTKGFPALAHLKRSCLPLHSEYGIREANFLAVFGPIKSRLSSLRRRVAKPLAAMPQEMAVQPTSLPAGQTPPCASSPISPDETPDWHQDASSPAHQAPGSLYPARSVRNFKTPSDPIEKVFCNQVRNNRGTLTEFACVLFSNPRNTLPAAPLMQQSGTFSGP